MPTEYSYDMLYKSIIQHLNSYFKDCPDFEEVIKRIKANKSSRTLEDIANDPNVSQNIKNYFSGIGEPNITFFIDKTIDKTHVEIEDWDSEKVAFRDEFYFPKIFTTMYDRAEADYRQYLANKENAKRVVLEPPEQLSPKGLALLSYLFAQKDGSQCQPMIASSYQDLLHIAELMEQATDGTNITIIYQDAVNSAHKTVMKFEKSEGTLFMLNMDSTNPDLYGKEVLFKLASDLIAKAQTEQREPTPLTLLRQGYNVDDPVLVNRQLDTFQCGAFALRDSRLLNRDPAIVSTMANQSQLDEHQDERIRIYAAPLEYQKSHQYKGYRDRFLLVPEANTQVVSKKGNKTLAQVYEKHEHGSYSHHFSEKYRDEVDDYLLKHKDNPSHLKEAVALFDAGNMTPERLAQIYGPQSEERKKLAAPVNQPVQPKQRQNFTPYSDAKKSEQPTPTPRQNIQERVQASQFILDNIPKLQNLDLSFELNTIYTELNKDEKSDLDASTAIPEPMAFISDALNNIKKIVNSIYIDESPRFTDYNTAMSELEELIDSLQSDIQNQLSSLKPDDNKKIQLGALAQLTERLTKDYVTPLKENLSKVMPSAPLRSRIQ